MNQDVKRKIFGAGLKLWQIAEKFHGGMSDGNFSRKLRHELSEADKAEIETIIKQLTGRNSK